MEQRPILRACAAVGGVGRMAALLGISAPSVSQWVSGIRPVPARRCRQIQEVTEGVVTVHDLRPDIFGQTFVTPDASEPTQEKAAA